MNTSPIEPRTATAETVHLSANSLTVDLADGRSIVVPLAWYPRLAGATVAERNNWRLIGHGEGIHWPDLDEDISVANLLRGAKSGEGQRSFNDWLQSRDPATDAARRVMPVVTAWHVVEVRPISNSRLLVTFADGTHGEVDLSKLIGRADAGVFEGLRDPVAFSRVGIVHGAVSWPNGVDLAPDAMYDDIKATGRSMP